MESEIQNSPESSGNDAGADRHLGAIALTATNFDARHKEIVDSSFDKARKKGEKLPGKNNERRNYAYLSRLENLVDKYGNDLEKKLWQASVKDNLLIDYNNIPDSYWQSKKQELRDNGYGAIELTEEYKHELFNKEREIQKESLEKWVNYLGDEHSPYPLWFKIYAWDGMTKMGKYDKSKGKYATRNETTVAPYPNPDAEVLGGVFEVINRYYGNNERKFYTEEGERNIELERVVQSGSFAKIYNAIEHDIAPIIEPPEKAEDVHGKWIEYGIGEEDDIAIAAKGTGWCVASPSVGRHYLEYGTYGQDDEWDDDNELSDEESSVESKFILFHLEDPTTGRLSKNAVASIRLDPNGQVAEISGLKEGQALNDSLVDVVAEKVKTLPGGEKFLEAFADKQELIRLDRKMQNNENLTKEELEFIYEINRRIHTLDTYNSYDPRVDELKQEYGIKYALNAGIDVNDLVPRLDSFDVAEELDTLIEHNANINDLVSKLDSPGVFKNLDTLIEHGANIDSLVSKLSPIYTVRKLNVLMEHGANIDINNLISRLDSNYVEEYLGVLISHGADLGQLMSKLEIENFDVPQLVEQGTDIDILVSKLDQRTIRKNFSILINHGANVNQLITKLNSDDIRNNFEYLISLGADINLLVSKLRKNDIIHTFFEAIINHPDVDISQLVSKLSGEHVLVYKLDTLINHGMDIEQIVSKLDSRDIIEHFDKLIDHGANINQLTARLQPSDIADNLDDLTNRGIAINVNELVLKLSPYYIVDNLSTLINHGANIDMNHLISKLNSYSIAGNLNELINQGADINQLVSKLTDSYDVARTLKTLVSHGADINQLVPKLDSDDTSKSMDTLIDLGADINLLLANLNSSDVERRFNKLIDHGADIQQIGEKIGNITGLDPYKLNTLRNHGWQKVKS